MKNIKTREELNEGKTLTGALPRDGAINKDFK